MSANDYYSGGGGLQQSHYGSGGGYNGGGDNSNSNTQPFSPPPTIYTPDSSTQHSPYPGSARPSYDQQNTSAGYGGGGYSPGPAPDHSYGGSPYPAQQDYGRPHSPYQQQQGQSQGQGYGGYQGSYDQPQSYSANNDYAARFGGSPYNNNNNNSPQPGHASPYGGPPAYSQQDNYYNNQPPPPGQYAQPGDPANPGDKGLLGALGGAAVGGYAGHQVNHGFLGTVGGAITGSVAEDAWKKKHKKDKKDKKDKKKWGSSGGGRRDSSSSSSSSSSSDDDKKKNKNKKKAAGAAAMRGNFSASSRGVELHGTELVAWCNPVRGAARRSALNLNGVLSNQRGNFVWARGGNFGASARHVRLVEGGRVLEAELGNGGGGWNRAWVRLDERITNSDGNLRFLD